MIGIPLHGMIIATGGKIQIYILIRVIIQLEYIHYLPCHPQLHRFSYDSMLNLQGNTAVYLEYAHARIVSISRKAGVDMEALKQSGKINITEPQEASLAIHITKFPAVVA